MLEEKTMTCKKAIKKIFYYLSHPRFFYVRFAMKQLNKEKTKLDDTQYLKRYFKIVFGKELNLNQPKTFNEKMQWLKLYNRKDIYTTMVDKHHAKTFVANIIGEKYVAKEFGLFKTVKEINLDVLPKSFVLKTTHGCGGVFVVKDKKKFDFTKAFSALTNSLSDNYYLHCREWPYKNIKKNYNDR